MLRYIDDYPPALFFSYSHRSGPVRSGHSTYVGGCQISTIGFGCVGNLGSQAGRLRATCVFRERAKGDGERDGDGMGCR